METLFLLSFAAGAFALAVWVDVRFPRLGPATWWRLAAHVAAGTILCNLVLGYAMAPFVGSQLGRLAAVFVIALPVLTYAMIGGVWTLRITRAAMGGPAR